MKHVMIDLETWGTTPGSALRSLGACVFNPKTGDIGPTFYRNISRTSCEGLGLTVDPRTEQWWSEQSAEARSALEPDQRQLGSVLSEFLGWWKTEVEDACVWSHGANFDVVLLESAFSAVFIEAPWKFWNVRCCRTVLALGNRKVVFARGVEHNALDDAVAQAKAVAAALSHGLPVGAV